MYKTVHYINRKGVTSKLKLQVVERQNVVEELYN